MEELENVLPQQLPDREQNQNTPPEQVRELIAEALQGRDQQAFIEAATRAAMDEVIQVQIERLRAQERRLEERVKALAPSLNDAFLDQQSQLERLAQSLRGPQRDLEIAQPVADTATRSMVRPPFEQKPAQWKLPVIPQSGPDPQPPDPPDQPPHR